MNKLVKSDSNKENKMKVLSVNGVMYNLSNFSRMSKDCAYDYYNFMMKEISGNTLVFEFKSEKDLNGFDETIKNFILSKEIFKEIEISIKRLP